MNDYSNKLMCGFETVEVAKPLFKIELKTKLFPDKFSYLRP